MREIVTIDTANGLLNAVLRYKCKCFGLCGGDKHRELDVDRYSIDYDENGRYLSLTSHPRTTKVG